MSPLPPKVNQPNFVPALNIVSRNPGRKHVGDWLPTDPSALYAVIKRVTDRAAKTADQPLTPEVQAYQDLIESDARAYMTAVNMIDEAAAMGPEFTFFTNYKEMIQCMNIVVQQAPPYSDGENSAAAPLNAILNWVMATESGKIHYFLTEVNEKLRAILDSWGTLLSSAASLNVFQDENGNSPGGWMLDPRIAEGMHEYDFPGSETDPAWGYGSWNEWFKRPFKEGVRPFSNPDDNSVICSACESTPFAFQQNVQLHDKFWAKNQPYSLVTMMNNDALASQFENGTVYQAYLSSRDYHRWHSPVNGVIVSATVVQGSYYAESPAVENDPSGPDASQGYITNVTTRAIIFIEATDGSGTINGPGLMCFIALGMSEISSNVLSVNKGDHVGKGDELGYFQYGGSSHCLVFRKDVIKNWSTQALPPLADWDSSAGTSGAEIIKLGTAIGSTETCW